MTDIFSRTVGIGHAKVDAYLRQREQVSADELNKLTVELRYVAACQDAVLRLTELCYVRAGARLVNVDNRTWRIGVDVPWSRTGHPDYGLRDWEARILRAIMLDRAGGKVPALFDYGNQRWHINLAGYPSMADAVEYWRRHSLTIDEWLQYADAIRAAARTRMQTLRAAA